MVERKSKDIEDSVLQKSDIETIIKVNSKAIELQGEVSDQYEEVISSLSEIKNKQEDIDDRIIEINKEIKDIGKTQFKILLLISSGIISVIIQVISLLKK
jgi:chromosome segregation ATPase